MRPPPPGLLLGLALVVEAGAAAGAPDVWSHGAPPIHVFGREEGVPQSSVTALAVEPGGRLWVGTQAGPAYHDGRRFHRVTLPDAGTSSFVWSLFVAHDGAVWLGMNGEHVIRLAGDAFRRFGAAEGLPGSSTFSLGETREGDEYKLWAGTQDGLYRLDGERFVAVPLDPAAPAPRVNAVRAGTLPSGEPTLWVAADRVYHCERGRCARLEAADGHFGAGDQAITLLESTGEGGQHVLWIGCKHGLHRVAGGRRESFTADGSPIPPGSVNALAETVTGSGKRVLWVGTAGGGLARFSGGRWSTLTSERAGLPDDIVTALLASGGAHGGRVLWIGTELGGLARMRHDGWIAFGQAQTGLAGAVYGMTEIDGEDGAPSVVIGVDDGVAQLTEKGWSPLAIAGQTKGAYVLSLSPAPGDPRALWIGTEQHGLRRWSAGPPPASDKIETPRKFGTINHMRRAAGGEAVWISSFGGLARVEGDRWEPIQAARGPLPSEDVRLTLETARPGREPSLWVATAAGLARREDGQWTIYTSATAPLPGDFVNSLAELPDPRGGRVLWIGTAGGAARLRLDSGEWLSSLTDRTEPALPDNEVYQIQGDAQGRVYLFTNGGVARLTPREPTPSEPAPFAIYTFTVDDGLPSNECNQNGSFVDSLGRIWAGTTRGAAVFDPTEEVAEVAPKPLVLTSARAGSELIPPGGELSWDRRTVLFDYTLLSFFREQDTRYRTRLAGFEAAPGEWSTDTKARYTNLSAGRYSFEVWARDYAGNVAGPVSIAFRVEPAPWQSWWAYLAYGAAALGLVYGATRARVRALDRQNRALEARILERTNELHQRNRELEEARAETERKNEALDRKLLELAEKNRELEESHRRADRIFSALAEALPGTVLDGKYRLESKIGAGGFGLVFRARHTALGRPVAVKVFRPAPGNDSAEALERFQREGMTACRLVHPNAVQIFDSGISDEGIAYLVMELLSGHSLAGELERTGALPLRRAAKILAEVCAALAAAHEIGLLHRDIKPENIFLHRAPEGETVKVVDFGIAKLMGNEEDEAGAATRTAILGTPYYMAPERFRGEPYDARSDIYSVGVTCYELLSGKRPYPEVPGGWPALLVHKLSKPPLPLGEAAPWVPAEVVDAVMRALSAAPAERPSLEELARIVGEAVAALPPEEQDRPRGRVRRIDPNAATIDASLSDAETRSLQP